MLRYASAITEQKKCWELFAQNIDLFQTARNNSQQRAPTCNSQQCCVRLHGALEERRTSRHFFLCARFSGVQLVKEKKSIFDFALHYMYFSVILACKSSVFCSAIHDFFFPEIMLSRHLGPKNYQRVGASQKRILRERLMGDQCNFQFPLKDACSRSVGYCYLCGNLQ